MLLKRSLVMAAALAVVASSALVNAGAASADIAIAGTFNPETPVRILDTRAGIGAPEAVVAAGATVTFDATDTITGTPGSMALTVTAVEPTAAGFLTVYEGGLTRPLASTVNFTAGRTIPNATVTSVGGDGTISIYNGSAGTLDLLVDLTGWWTAGAVDPTTAGALTTLTPARVRDTRDTPGTPVAAETNSVVPIDGIGGVPATGVSAVLINLTVADPKTAGYLTAAAEAQQPADRTSTVNFVAGEVRANLATVPVNPDGSISIYNGAVGTVQFVVDVLGYFSDGTPAADGSFVVSTPYRAADTRLADSAPLPALTTSKIQLLPDDGTAAIFKAVSITVTAVSPQSAGFLTVWDGVTSLPPTSNGNFLAGEVGASTVIVPVRADGSVTVYNGSYGNLNLVIDVQGFVLNDLSNFGQSVALQKVTAAVAQARNFATKNVAS